MPFNAVCRTPPYSRQLIPSVVCVFVARRPQKVPRHRSDAQERIAALPPVEVKGTVAMCDGGGGATGHPIEWIQLDKREGRQPETCKYCGVRYIMAEGHHGH